MIMYLFTILVFYLLPLKDYKHYKNDKNFRIVVSTIMNKMNCVHFIIHTLRAAFPMLDILLRSVICQIVKNRKNLEFVFFR